ncbi:MAG TPA: hypothetical protein VFA44_08700 [Gaiellaceae bacterium]|nr:hypothetical protein [Gaiellaceae bacterium]
MSALPETRLAWQRLGQILRARGLVTELQLQQALRDQEVQGGRLGEILYARGWVSAIALRDALAEQHGLDLQVERLAGAEPGESRGMPLGRLLVEGGHITDAQLERALAEQSRTGQRLGQILIGMGAVSSFVLAAALAEQRGLLAERSGSPAARAERYLPPPRTYELHEIVDGRRYRLYASRDLLDVTDLAFAVLYEWEPEELHIVCTADGAQPLAG